MAEVLGKVVGDNLRTWRVLRRLSQDEMARRMTEIGSPWGQPAVSTVERGVRDLTIVELGAAALVLGVDLGTLLDPAGVEGRQDVALLVGTAAIPPKTARAWLRGQLGLRAGGDGSLSAEPTEGNEGVIVGIVDELRELRKPRKTTTDKRRATARRKGNP